MVHEPPKQTHELLELVKGSDHPRDWPIRTHYPGYESTFLMLHPFLRIKKGHSTDINFKTGNWPTKTEITKFCEPVTWNQILHETGIIGIKNLDRALAFYHCATRNTDLTSYKKLIELLEQPDLIPPQVDNFPEIFEDRFLKELTKVGISEVYVFSDIDEKSKPTYIQNLLKEQLPYHVRVESKSSDFQMIQDFDQRFSYLNGTKELVSKLVINLNLEGFYCDETTLEAWSFEPAKHLKHEWPKAE